MNIIKREIKIPYDPQLSRQDNHQIMCGERIYFIYILYKIFCKRREKEAVDLYFILFIY